jgi:CCR4-NOT transcriptional regulation complex NOT5 subunit
MLLTVAMAAMMAIGAGTAFAQTTTTGPVCGPKVQGVTTCVTTTTTKTTSTETTTVAGPPIVINLDNTSVSTPTGGPCEVGNSGRVGTAEGTSTQEFENISTQQTEITVTNTFETTTTSVKTETFTGNTKGKPETSETVTSPPVKVLTGTTTSDPIAVGDAVLTSTPIGDPVFTATGKCKNVSGPQPQARG